jgi:DNA-binding transcriptional LysR family regulator
MNDVEARELRYFIAVAEALSFSRADELSAAYWAGHDDTSPYRAQSAAGPAVRDILLLLETVALGQAVAFLPSSTQQRFPRSDIAYRPVWMSIE